MSPEIRLAQLANAFQLSRAVQVAARLGIGRRLDEGERSVAELARTTGTDERTLGRLLRFLAEIGVVAEVAEGRYGSTPLSERLHLVDNLAQGEEAWAAWSALPRALETGRSVFAEVHGAEFYELAARRPEQGARWNEWMELMGKWLAPTVAAALGLKGDETVVDVGGARGNLLAEVLSRHPGCRGVLLDLPSAVDGAEAVLERAGVADRCEVTAGDALEEVPRGGDVYVLSRVLQNCDDERAARLLERCAAAMDAPSRLVAIEALMPDRGDPRRRSLAAADLNYLLLWGGAHRTSSEIESLFARAGLESTDVEELPEAGGAGWHTLRARRRTSDPPGVT